MATPLAWLRHLRKQVTKDRLRRRTRVVVEPASSPPAAPPLYLAMCAIMKNEGSYLREWLEFHRLVGVEHFYLYDNGSDDDTAAVVAPYVAAGVVTLTQWPRFLRDSNPQYLAYAHCVRLAAARARWLAVVDVDEFLFPPAGDDVRDVLRGLEAAGTGAVAVFRREFATCGHRERPPGPVIASYTRRRPDAARSRSKVKSIVRPACVSAIDSAHRFELVPGGEFVDESGAPLRKGADGLFAERVARLRVNHYFTKSLAEYRAKVQRGRMVDRPDWEAKFASQVAALEEGASFDDAAILRFLPALAARLSAPPGAAAPRAVAAPKGG
jgi:hypothetical protein